MPGALGVSLGFGCKAEIGFLSHPTSPSQVSLGFSFHGLYTLYVPAKRLVQKPPLTPHTLSWPRAWNS